MVRLLVPLLVAGLLLVSGERSLAQERRVALVVGISSYTSAQPLSNAVGDANAVADMLRQAAFDVVAVRSDVTNMEFKRAIRDFEETASNADIAVVFYAGHGIEVRNTNYLIPSDAKLLNERDVEDEAIPLDRVITALEPAKRLRLVILDACRDNPFASKMKRREATRAWSVGLSRVEPSTRDTLIAYAARENTVAYDGGEQRSPYTGALLRHLTVPGLDIRIAFGRIRDDVMKATGSRQEPYVYGSLGGDTVALVAGVAVPPAGARQDPAAVEYEIAKREGTREGWQVFLNRHGSGIYADLARAQLEKADYDLASRDGTREAWEVFLRRYDTGLYADLARVHREKLIARAEREEAEAQAATSRLAAEEQARKAEDLARLRRAEDSARDLARRLEAEARAQAARAAREEQAARRQKSDDRLRAAEAARRDAEAQAAAKRQEAEDRARKSAELAQQRSAAERERTAASRLAKERQQKAARAASRQKDVEARLALAEARKDTVEREKAKAEARIIGAGF
ncbi:MAG TPA: caspase family protein [Microvirga sp.]|nr:caspase family protein [Microvirga sp.]